MSGKCLIALLLAFAGSPVAAVADEGASARVLVFGGTGRLGSEIVKALVADRHKVTVFARDTSNRERLGNLSVDYVIGDVLEADSVELAFGARRYDVVVDALGRGSATVDFYRVSAENIAHNAARTGVRQIILHGSVGAGDSAESYANQAMSDGMRRLMAAKSAGETAVVASGTRFTIIRNSRLLPYGTPESGNARLYEDRSLTGPVTRAGLARLTAGCVLNPECFDKIYHAVDRSRPDR